MTHVEDGANETSAEKARPSELIAANPQWRPTLRETAGDASGSWRNWKGTAGRTEEGWAPGPGPGLGYSGAPPSPDTRRGSWETRWEGWNSGGSAWQARAETAKTTPMHDGAEGQHATRSEAHSKEGGWTAPATTGWEDYKPNPWKATAAQWVARGGPAGTSGAEGWMAQEWTQARTWHDRPSKGGKGGRGRGHDRRAAEARNKPAKTAIMDWGEDTANYTGEDIGAFMEQKIAHLWKARSDAKHAIKAAMPCQTAQELWKNALRIYGNAKVGAGVVDSHKEYYEAVERNMGNELDAASARLAEALSAEFGIEHDIFCLSEEQCWQAEKWEADDGSRIGRERDGRKLKIVTAIFHGKNIAEFGGRMEHHCGDPHVTRWAYERVHERCRTGWSTSAARAQVIDVGDIVAVVGFATKAKTAERVAKLTERVIRMMCCTQAMEAAGLEGDKPLKMEIYDDSGTISRTSKVGQADRIVMVSLQVQIAGRAKEMEGVTPIHSLIRSKGDRLQGALHLEKIHIRGSTGNDERKEYRIFPKHTRMLVSTEQTKEAKKGLEEVERQWLLTRTGDEAYRGVPLMCPKSEEPTWSERIEDDLRWLKECYTRGGMGNTPIVRRNPSELAEAGGGELKPARYKMANELMEHLLGFSESCEEEIGRMIPSTISAGENNKAKEREETLVTTCIKGLGEVILQATELRKTGRALDRVEQRSQTFLERLKAQASFTRKADVLKDRLSSNTGGHTSEWKLELAMRMRKGCAAGHTLQLIVFDGPIRRLPYWKAAS